jgi:hypothetical protein
LLTVQVAAGPAPQGIKETQETNENRRKNEEKERIRWKITDQDILEGVILDISSPFLETDPVPKRLPFPSPMPDQVQ